MLLRKMLWANKMAVQGTAFFREEGKRDSVYNLSSIFGGDKIQMNHAPVP
jgi:hypothetical protein